MANDHERDKIVLAIAKEIITLAVCIMDMKALLKLNKEGKVKSPGDQAC